jgi:hypothetical protein
MTVQGMRQVMWVIGSGSLVVALASGAIISLVYQPLSHLQQGRLYRAETAITDFNGDTLLREGEWVLLESVPPHRGSLVPVGDTAQRWSAALLSHAELVLNPHGKFLVAIHSVAATALVATVAAIAVVLVVGGYHWRSRDAAWILLLSTLLVTSWLGTTLPADRRAIDAYDVGQSFLADNLPVIGDVVKLVLPARADVVQRFVIHALWLGALVIMLFWVCAPKRLRNWSWSIGASASGIVALGCVYGALVSPVAVHMESQPLWHLAVVFKLLHYLPTDATMLVCTLWWAGAFASGLSMVRWIRYLGAAMVSGWFVVGVVVSLAG